MAVTNTLTQTQQKPKFSVAIQGEQYKKLINNTLTDPRKASRFIASISSAVATNPALQDCDAASILSAGLLGEALGLSPSPQLGYYYLVPYKHKEKRDKQGKLIQAAGATAQFQLGYKGYIQLAQRSGQYKTITVLPLKHGELEYYNQLTGEIIANLIEDDDARETAETIGYYAFFETLNGFRKSLYWTISHMERHADRYSQAFNLKQNEIWKSGKVPESEAWKYSSFWYKDFDGMACKTMLRQLLSKWGPMSIELERAYVDDMTDGNGNYIDNDDTLPPIIDTTDQLPDEPVPIPNAGKGTKAAASKPPAPAPIEAETIPDPDDPFGD